jgi:hypothetical protein
MSKEPPNTACTRRLGVCRIFKHFYGFKFSLFPNILHARPSAMLRERKPLGGTLHHRILIRETGGAFRLPLNRQGEDS